MAHEVHLTADEDYTGTLTLGAHPDGEVDFEEGVAIVEDQEVAETLAARYPNIRVAGEVDVDTSDSSESESGESGESVAEPAIDPSEYTISELEAEIESGDYTDNELETIREAESATDDRDGAIEAIDAALGA